MRFLARITPLFRIIRTPALIILLLLLTPGVWIGWTCGTFRGITPEPATPVAPTITANLKGYSRAEDQTYLTLPEWYVVYSADEYAAFLQSNKPSQFPYFSAIAQYWDSYRGVCAVTRVRYPFNTGYHFGLYIVGVSFTAEYIVKGLYENTLGRATEWLSTDELTEEDAYARAVHKEFGDFIHTVPWYEFAYADKLSGLWANTKPWGPNIVRKWERKIALSLEFGVKAVYGWVIKQGTAGVYAPEDLQVQAIVSGANAELAKPDAKLRLIQAIDTQTQVVALTRYEAFTRNVPPLLKQGVRFVEIAGNDDILVTAWAPQDWRYDLKDGTLLFDMPILTQPQNKRVVLIVPVKTLHDVLADLEARAVKLEHLYDY